MPQNGKHLPRSGGKKVARRETSGAELSPCSRRRRDRCSSEILAHLQCANAYIYRFQTFHVWLPSVRRFAAKLRHYLNFVICCPLKQGTRNQRAIRQREYSEQTRKGQPERIQAG